MFERWEATKVYAKRTHYGVEVRERVPGGLPRVLFSARCLHVDADQKLREAGFELQGQWGPGPYNPMPDGYWRPVARTA